MDTSSHSFFPYMYADYIDTMLRLRVWNGDFLLLNTRIVLMTQVIHVLNMRCKYLCCFM